MYSPIKELEENYQGGQLVQSRSHENLATADSCGYDHSSISMADTRSVKFQAKKNHKFTASASKSYNAKDYYKYLKKRQEKLDRDEHKAE